MQGVAHVMRQGVTDTTPTSETDIAIKALDTGMKTNRRRISPTPIVLTGLTLAALLNTVGCSGGDDEGSPDSPSSSTSTVPGLTADIKVGTVSGSLPDATKTQAAADLGAVVTKWFDAAYLGDYPREGAGEAFGTFTEGAAELARKDALMSNVAHGAQIESVTPEVETVLLDLVAADKKVVGATARVRLEFTTTGGYAKTVTIVGRVFLTPGDKGGWRIFGYDMQRGEK